MQVFLPVKNNFSHYFQPMNIKFFYLYKNWIEKPPTQSFSQLELVNPVLSANKYQNSLFA